MPWYLLFQRNRNTCVRLVVGLAIDDWRTSYTGTSGLLSRSTRNDEAAASEVPEFISKGRCEIASAKGWPKLQLSCGISQDWLTDSVGQPTILPGSAESLYIKASTICFTVFVYNLMRVLYSAVVG